MVVFDKVTHSFPLKILNFIKNDVDPLVKETLLFAFSSVKLSIELQHWVFSFGIGPSNPVLD